MAYKKPVALYDEYTLVGLLVFFFFLIGKVSGRVQTSDVAKIHEYGMWCFVGSIISYILIAIRLYKGEIIERIVYIFTFFLSIASIVFLAHIPSLEYYYNEYTLIIFAACFPLVGLVTTLFSSAGFVGVLSDNKTAIVSASYKLLAWSLLIVAGASLIHYYGLSSDRLWTFLFFVIPFIVWQNMYLILRKKLNSRVS